MHFSKFITKRLIYQRIATTIAFGSIYLSRVTANWKSKTSENILVISLNKLGDTVFTIPAIKQIMNKYGGNIWIVCFADSQIIYEQVLSNVKYITLRKEDFFWGERIAKRAARRKFTESNPKIIFDLTLSIISASLLFNSKADIIVGSNNQLYESIYTNFCPIRKKPHLIEMYLEAVSTLINVVDTSWRQGYNQPYMRIGSILLHPLGGWRAKEWNLNKYITLYQRLSVSNKVGFVVPKGSFNSDVCEELSEKKITVIETESFRDLIDQIKLCSIFIGNDSGPIYIASLLGKPTFTLYGPTNPKFHSPFGNNHKYIQRTITCTPNQNQKMCFTNGGRDGCPVFQCENLLNIENVFEGISAFINEFQNRASIEI